MRARRRGAPEPVQHLLDATLDEMLIVVETQEVHPQDLEHRIREIAVPAAGAKADLTEDLAVAEIEGAEGVGARDEVVEGALVPIRDQRIPERLDAGGITRPERRLQLGEGRLIGKRAVVGLGDLTVDRGQVLEATGEQRLALEVDHGRSCGFAERIRERMRAAAHHVEIVEEAAR